MTFSAHERRRLADLFLKVGPDAPTLCEGWVTRDLAAHLYVRENLMLRGGMDTHRRRDFTELVEDWREGPGRLNPMRVFDTQVNTAEHFIHHEDVRRGDGTVEPRDFSRRVDEMLRDLVARFAPIMVRKAPRPIVLTPAGMRPITVGDSRGVSELGDAVIRVSGQPGELLLWVYGRDAVDVEVSGDTAGLVRAG